MGGVAAATQPWTRAQGRSSAPPIPDLLIKGGRLIDPANGVNGLRDLLVRGGRVHAVGEIDAAGVHDFRVIEARGKWVVPGLVDLHAHVGTAASPLGLPVDAWVGRFGVTTCVSAGDVGAPDWAAFRDEVLDRLETRVFAFLHVSNLGLQSFPAPEMLDLRDISIDRLAAVIAAESDRLLGVKVREGSAIVGRNGIEPLRRAIAAAERAGTGARVMCHIGDAPGEMSDLLGLLRPGDVLTHCFSGLGNNIVQAGRLLPAAREAQARGVIFDVGHGGGSFDFAVAEAAIDEGLRPHTISSDLHRASMATPGDPRLPWIMSKFLALGFSLEEVVEMTTVRPARVIDRIEKLGTLGVGAPADVTMFEMVEEPTEFLDTTGKGRAGDRHLRLAGVIRAGQVVV